ncbi:MATE efflux family protein [Xylona heveae TC161]|uniref:MATE efflux family protein n=1 Tax=Xylona heveae (strain CBS 132557 / TC161) TaxID=1328760 RepID=A0A165HEE5_XYLHT|nr:MATE efflux family protein [Xylona heveae TC161]KZF23386.1 MATE efflux family protein [Xylona heveae TC161]
MDAQSTNVHNDAVRDVEAELDTSAMADYGYSPKALDAAENASRNVDVFFASSYQSHAFGFGMASPPVSDSVFNKFPQFQTAKNDGNTDDVAHMRSDRSILMYDDRNPKRGNNTSDNLRIEDLMPISEAENKFEDSSLIKVPSVSYGSVKITHAENPVEAEIVAGTTSTTWRIEAQFLAMHARPLILTGLLQFSLMASSLFTVSRLGTLELGAASLGNSVATVTGYVVYQGLATGLDTLCSQAYGSGRKTIVGLHMQRMICFLLLATIPIVALWTFSSPFLATIVPDPEQVQLTNKYLRILAIGAPFFALFEAGKRFLQAQGLFSAMFYVLVICAPLNGMLSWLFVWKFKWGFLGAPLAIVATQTMLPLCLLLYVIFIKGRECWGGFDRSAFHKWGPMVKLSLPGLVTMLGEWFVYLFVTLLSSRFSPDHLAAQSIVSTAYSICFQGAFCLAIVGTTRTANLVGSGLPESAKLASKVALVASLVAGTIICLLVTIFRRQIPRMLTDDETVIQLAANILPICGINMIGDAFVTTCNGVMRAAGRQHVSGILTLIAYYMICLPIAFGLGFGSNLNLQGLWLGFSVAYAFMVIVEYLYIREMNWKRVIEEALERIQ